MHSELNLDARNKSVNSKRLISKYLEYIQGSKKAFPALLSRRAKWIRPTHQTRLNVFKHHLPCLHTSAVFETSSKSLSRTTTKKINPLCLDAFDTDAASSQIQMRYGGIDRQHLRQFLAECNCARQLFEFTDDSHHNIYTPLDPSPPLLGHFFAALPIACQIDVNDRFVRLQGCG